MAFKYTNITVPAIASANGPGSNPQRSEDAPLTENQKPGPVGSTPALPVMHEKAHAAIVKQRHVLHRFGNK